MEDISVYGNKVDVPLLDSIKTEIVNPLITLLAIGALVVFLWGLVVFIWNAGDAEAQSKGRQVMIWGIAGLVVIFGAWSIVTLIGTTVGVDSSEFEKVR